MSQYVHSREASSHRAFPGYFTCPDQCIELLNNLKSGGCQCEHRVKSIGIVLSALMDIIWFANHCSEEMYDAETSARRIGVL
jgi:hypothetical protein